MGRCDLYALVNIPSLQNLQPCTTLLPLNAGLLPRAEETCALRAFGQVSRILRENPLPSATLFDMDGTLLEMTTEQLYGRTVGAMHAFHGAGVPIGIYSLRPSPDIFQTLYEHKLIYDAVARIRESGMLVFDIDFYRGQAVTLCRGLAHVETGIWEFKSLISPTTTIKMPTIKIGKNGRSEEIDPPKFLPYDDVILVDNTDFRENCGRIIKALSDVGDRDSALFRSAELLSARLWHIGTAPAGADFSDTQLAGLVEVLGMLGK